MSMKAQAPEWLLFAWQIVCDAGERGISQRELARKLGRYTCDSVLLVMEMNGLLLSQDDEGRLYAFGQVDAEGR